MTDLRWMDQTKVPIFAVKGNHDVDDPLGAFDRATDITGQVIEPTPGLLVAGIGWSGEQFFDLPTERDIQNVCNLLQRELARRRAANDQLILLTHYPGKFPELFPSTGIAGSWWYESIRAFIFEMQPVLVIQGHLHEHAGMRAMFAGRHMNIPIIYPGNSGVTAEVDVQAIS